jgi:BMFP domain-containing protein YqiC
MKEELEKLQLRITELENQLKAAGVQPTENF